MVCSRKLSFKQLSFSNKSLFKIDWQHRLHGDNVDLSVRSWDMSLWNLWLWIYDDDESQAGFDWEKKVDFELIEVQTASMRSKQSTVPERYHPEPRHCEVGWKISFLTVIQPLVYATYPVTAGLTDNEHRGMEWACLAPRAWITIDICSDHHANYSHFLDNRGLFIFLYTHDST